MTSPAARPVPAPDDASGPFFDGAARGALMIQRCRDCGTYLAPVREVCSECLRSDLEWAEASGRGTLHTFGVMHRVYHPGFAGLVPYNVAVVELAEGPRVNANVVGAPNEALRVGMALQATFEEMTPGVFVPQFKPA
jgi:uncharacterized OB-fold protein